MGGWPSHTSSAYCSARPSTKWHSVRRLIVAHSRGSTRGTSVTQAVKHRPRKPKAGAHARPVRDASKEHSRHRLTHEEVFCFAVRILAVPPAARPSRCPTQRRKREHRVKHTKEKYAEFFLAERLVRVRGGMRISEHEPAVGSLRHFDVDEGGQQIRVVAGEAVPNALSGGALREPTVPQ